MSALAHRRSWAQFVAGSIALVAVMAALSVAVLRDERRATAVAARETHAARLREATTAMDRWLGPVLAREAGRHHSDYASYRAPRRAFSHDLVRLPPGEILEPSPLLGHSADTILLHVEWSEATGARSPEVPRGKERDLALQSGLPPETLRLAEERLDALASRVDLAALARSVRAEAPAPSLAIDAPPEALRPEGPATAPDGATPAIDQTACLAPDELRETSASAGLVEDAGGASVGPLVARWVLGELLFARDVRSADASQLQVIQADWPALSAHLLHDAARDLSGARLVPGRHAEGVALATIPATLVADAPLAGRAGWTEWETRLALGWLAGLVALGAIGWALRASIDNAERRARFAAAVSHELRTPLTTLQLYSDLLADGVIRDPAARQEYLETIRAESARLASLVENVLMHARIEQANPVRRRLRVAALVESIVPVLRRRADAAGRPLVVHVADELLGEPVEVEVDPAAVERVLFNLVDNACKHAVATADPTLSLEVRRRGGLVDLEVQDAGPGIPRALGNAVFEAFRRGEDTSAPGAGLGLALSRSLARELHGDLSLVPTDRGACFRLSLHLS